MPALVRVIRSIPNLLVATLASYVAILTGMFFINSDSFRASLSHSSIILVSIVFLLRP